MDYDLLARQMEELAREEEWYVPLLANASALLMETLPDLNWAGFYLVREGALVLGPFQGKAACIHIAPGKGVCGTALGEGRTVRVENVHAFPGHIACDGASNAEIVIPLRQNGRVMAVMDLDSPLLGRFDAEDQAGLEKIARILENAARFDGREGHPGAKKTIYLAGGCFWGCQKYFDLIPGVLETEVGYANGPTENPSYEAVKAQAGHAETVRVAYDPRALPLDALLEKFFHVIDPTAVNRQGEDRGIQYRTGVYYTDVADVPVIQRCLQALAARYDRPLAIEMKALENFYPAEEYHQKYLMKHPDGYCHIHFD